MENYAHTDQVLWRCKSSGYKCIVILSVCMLILLVSMLGMLIGAKNDNGSIVKIFLTLFALSAVAGLTVSILSVRSELRWETFKLIFTLADSGLYFTDPNAKSYFYALWSEIESYSVDLRKNGKANVIVNFNCLSDAGTYGKIKRVKMIGVSNVDVMNEVFSKFGVRLDASKN